MSLTVRYSIIILLEEPHRDFPQFARNLHHLLGRRKESFEILVVANGTGNFLRQLFARFPEVFSAIKAFELNTRTSQAVSLKLAAKESSGEIIVVLGSYQQLSDASLSKILDSFDARTDIVCPWRQNRVDPWLSQLQSRVFNYLVRKLVHSSLHDLSCTVLAFRREVLENTDLYGNLYRFLPLLAGRKGFRVKELKCAHCQERGPTGFYSFSSYISRLIDIFIVYFNTRFTRKPLRFFSTLGLLFFLLGSALTLKAFLGKLLLDQPLGSRPILLLAIFLMVLGVQAWSIGLLGEIMAFIHGRHRKDYTIGKIL